MPLVFSKINGVKGRVEIPELGAPICEIATGTLTRRAAEGPDSDFWDLHAVLLYSNAMLFADPDYHKVVWIQLPGKTFVLCAEEGDPKMTLHGKSLVVERVKLCPPK